MVPPRGRMVLMVSAYYLGSSWCADLGCGVIRLFFLRADSDGVLRDDVDRELSKDMGLDTACKGLSRRARVVLNKVGNTDERETVDAVLVCVPNRSGPTSTP